MDSRGLQSAFNTLTNKNLHWCNGICEQDGDMTWEVRTWCGWNLPVRKEGRTVWRADERCFRWNARKCQTSPWDTHTHFKLTMRRTEPLSNSLAYILNLLEILPTPIFGELNRGFQAWSHSRKTWWFRNHQSQNSQVVYWCSCPDTFKLLLSEAMVGNYYIRTLKLTRTIFFHYKHL